VQSIWHFRKAITLTLGGIFMRKVLFFYGVFLVFISSGYPQDTIKNPERPLSDNAGRVLKLEEELRITDESGRFFFQYPRDIKIAPDGSYYFYDREQLIQLDKEGRFIRNFFRKGQGPGELTSVSNFFVLEDTLVVHSNNPNKIVWFDFQGELVKELSLQKMGSYARLQFYRDGKFYLIKSGTPSRQEKPEVLDIPQILIELSEKTDEQKELISFPLKALAMGGAWVSGTSVLSAPFKGRYLFVSHTQEYSVNLYDCESQKLLSIFNRSYKRIKKPKNAGGAVIIIDGTKHEAPGSEYLNDISGLFIFRDKLWVHTSLKDEKKGDLIDVFDLDGKYVDCFYLRLNGRLLSTQGDSLFVREKDPDELIQIVRYKVIDG
jgi:hypothetical protein